MRSGIAGLVLARATWIDGHDVPALLLADATGTTLLGNAVRALVQGGCEPILVVVGDRADLVRAELADIDARWVDSDLHVIECDAWGRGEEEVLRTGLRALPGLAVEQQIDLKAVVVTVPDLPDQGAEVVQRLVAGDPRGSGALARTTYGGRMGYPVLLGRDRWSAAAEEEFDEDASPVILRSPGTVLVDATDLGSGRTVAPGGVAPGRWGPPGADV